jgi:hypothetical protein
MKKKSLRGRRLSNEAPISFNSMLSDVFDTSTGYGTLSPLSQPYGLAFSDQYNPVTLNRILMAYSYFTHGVLQTMIDVPIEDAYRGGVDFECDQLDPEDLQLLKDVMQRCGDIKAMKDTQRWAGVFGGAGLIINTAQDPAKELDPDAINENTPLRFIAADRWEILLNFLQEDDVPTPYNYYGQPLHRSRVVKILGKEAPSYIRGRLQGWGMSEYERVLRPIQQYLKQDDLIYELMDEAKIDVFRFNGYNTLLASGQGRQLLNQRLQMANMGKNFHNAVVMDAEDEYIQKQLTFSGLADIDKQIMVKIAAAIGIPMTKIFGLSAAGFNSGEDDIENYNARVESEHRAKALDILSVVVPIRCKQIFGFVPEHIEYKFKPLRVLGAEAETQVKAAKFNMHSALFSQGFYTDKEYATTLKQEKITVIDTEVAQGIRSIEPPAPSVDFDVPQKMVPVKTGEAK